MSSYASHPHPRQRATRVALLHLRWALRRYPTTVASLGATIRHTADSSAAERLCFVSAGTSPETRLATATRSALITLASVVSQSCPSMSSLATHPNPVVSIAQDVLQLCGECIASFGHVDVSAATQASATAPTATTDGPPCSPAHTVMSGTRLLQPHSLMDPSAFLFTATPRASRVGATPRRQCLTNHPRQYCHAALLSILAEELSQSRAGLETQAVSAARACLEAAQGRNALAHCAPSTRAFVACGVWCVAGCTPFHPLTCFCVLAPLVPVFVHLLVHCAHSLSPHVSWL